MTLSLTPVLCDCSSLDPQSWGSDPMQVQNTNAPSWNLSIVSLQDMTLSLGSSMNVAMSLLIITKSFPWLQEKVMAGVTFISAQSFSKG